MKTQPNIVVFLTDDHAPRAISAYDQSLVQTPNIDRLRKEGVRCDAAFCTNAICSPSRASILTGKYSHVNGVPRFNSLVGVQPNVARYLQAAGYYTAVVGKWHLGTEPTGFDHWDILPIQGEYNDAWFTSKEGRRKVPGYTTNVLTELSLDVLRKRPKDRPFALFVHHKAPHDPCTPRPDLESRFVNDVLPYPPSFNDDGEGKSKVIGCMMEQKRRRQEKLESGTGHIPSYYSNEEQEKVRQGARPEVTLPDGTIRPMQGEERRRWNYQKHLKDYLRCVLAVDESVGQILDELDVIGLVEDMLVVYTADHGLCLGDHGIFDKRLMYDPSIRVPLLARWPGKIPAGTTTDRLAINVDLAPTLLEAAGLPVPADMQGRSLWPIWSGTPKIDWRRSFYYRFYGSESYRPTGHPPHYGVRTERYKLIYFPETAEFELYDLQEDPHELCNLSSSAAHASLRRELQVEIVRLRDVLDDYDQFSRLRSDIILDNEEPDFVLQHPMPTLATPVVN